LLASLSVIILQLTIILGLSSIQTLLIIGLFFPWIGRRALLNGKYRIIKFTVIHFVLSVGMSLFVGICFELNMNHSLANVLSIFFSSLMIFNASFLVSLPFSALWLWLANRDTSTLFIPIDRS
jgi:hypothetical protein